MYTIKQASARSGLPIQTIRAWERRYGVVQPDRTAAGYRLYDDAAITGLIAMRHLVEAEGWRPSQAAERVRAAGDDVGSLVFPESAPAREQDLPTPDSDGRANAAIEAYVSAAHRLDVPAMNRVLDEAFASQRFESAIDDVIFPSLRAIGEAWAAGELDVAQEHVASETVRRRLVAFFDAAGQTTEAPRVLIGLPPGGAHELGALAFAVASRRAGLAALYLGSNVPLESWLRTARETSASLVILAVVTSADVRAARLVVQGLRTLANPPICALGGPRAPNIAEGTGVVVLPPGTDTAVAAAIALQASNRSLRHPSPDAPAIRPQERQVTSERESEEASAQQPGHVHQQHLG